MKEKELREAANCAMCGKPFGHSGLPLFWRVTIERFGVDYQAMRRQDGLTGLLGGNVALAQIMGPDENIATPMMEPIKVTVCEPCSQKPVELIQFL
jgi:hypothetical protein